MYIQKQKLKQKILLSYKKTLIIRTNFLVFLQKNPTISDKLIYEQKKKNFYLWNDVYFTPIYIKNLLFF